MLDDDVTGEQLLYSLFGLEGVAAQRNRALAYGCRCSRQRLSSILEGFPGDDLDHMAVEGDIVMTCEFCNLDFRFGRGEIRGAIRRRRAGRSLGRSLGMTLGRRTLLLLPLAVSGCGGDRPTRQGFPALTFGYLTPIRLNVASVEDAPLPPPGPLDALDPAPPGPTLLQMAQDRLTAGGSLGRALFTVETATLTRSGNGLDGTFSVRLDVMTSDGTRAAFAQARVSRRVDGIGSDLRAALYDITAQMMNDMNVEFEFQVKQSLRDWLQETTTAPAPAAVEQQPLSRPGPQ